MTARPHHKPRIPTLDVMRATGRTQKRPVPMKPLMEWANVMFTALSGVGEPHANEIVAGALARLIHRRRRRPGDR